MSYEKAYPCVGGPLAGMLVKRSEFQAPWKSANPSIPDLPPGPLHEHKADYIEFNRADRRKNVPSMIWLHRPLLEGK